MLKEERIKNTALEYHLKVAVEGKEEPSKSQSSKKDIK